jgi:hypothetical protein
MNAQGLWEEEEGARGGLSCILNIEVARHCRGERPFSYMQKEQYTKVRRHSRAWWASAGGVG